MAWLCLVGGIFSADLLLPLGYAVPMLYVLPLLLTWFLPARGVRYWAAGGLIGLTILGVLCSSGPLFPAVLFNRAVASILLLSIAAGLEQARRLAAKTAAAVQQSEQAIARIARLKHLSAWSLTLSGDPNHIFDEASRVLGQMFDVRIVCLSEIVGEELLFKSLYMNGQVTRNAGRCPLAITPCATVKTAKDLRVFDRVMERFPEAAFLRAHQAMAYCGVPSLDSRGEVVAVTCLLDDKPRDFTEEEQELLRIFAQRIATEIERARQAAAQSAAEAALRESEERWQYAFEGSGDGVWDWNAQTNQVYFSTRWKTMLGYEPHEIGDTFGEWDCRVHPEDKAAAYEEIRKHFDGEPDLYVSEHRLLCKDGSYKWILARGKVVTRDAHGKPLRVVGTHTDLTERKRAEERLRESEAFLASVLDNLPNMVFVKEAEGLRFVRLNKAGEALLGYSHDELLGKNDYDFFPAKDAETFTAADRRVLAGGRLLDIPEEGIQTKHNGIRYLHTKKIPLTDSNGTPRYLLGISEDITERKQSEERLRQSEAFIASVLNHLPSVVFVKEARELRHVRFNRACEELLGVSAQDILGKNNFDLFPKEQADLFTAKDREVLASGHLVDIPEERIDTPHGVRYLHTRKIPMFGATGEPAYLVGISEDITERKRMEQALRESHAELERRVFERTMDLAESNHALRVEIDERQRMEAQLRESEGRLNQAQALAHLGSWELDVEAGRLTWSDETFRIFGIEPGEGVATYESFLACVHPDDRAAVDAAYAGSIRDGLDSYEIEHRIVAQGTGDIRIVHEKCVHIRNAAGAVVRSLGMVHDVTGRKQLEAMRQAHAVMDRVMQEREALMRNLHDGVLQSLYALRLGLEHSRRLLASQSGNAQKSLDVQIEDLALMIAEVRRFMGGQDPVWAQAETIRSGLSTLIDTYRGVSSVEWLLELPERDEELADLPPDEIRHLLYIVREAMSNVVRHASATRCRIALVPAGDRWQMTIEDDGCGFNPADSRKQGLGMGNMEARARQIGAAIAITTAPGTGTRIVITLIRRATHVSI
jgi:PAS domain S-box-containing protein